MTATNPAKGSPYTPADLIMLMRGLTYSADEFVIDSTNKHDHSENKQVKIRPDVSRLVEMVVEQRGEYRTAEDFWRDAAWHRLHYLLETDPVTDPQVEKRMRAIQQISRMESVRLDQEIHATAMADAVATLDMCAEVGNWDHMNEILEYADAEANDGNNLPGWREDFQRISDYAMDMMKNGPRNCVAGKPFQGPPQ